MNKNLLGIKIGTLAIKEMLVEVDQFFKKRASTFFHIVNLNPDIFVLANQNARYRQIINQADSTLIDGIGIQIVVKLLGYKCGERMTGTDFMQLLVKYAANNRKKVMFLGGDDNTAKLTGEKLKVIYPTLQFISESGVKDIRKEKSEERNRVLSLIKNYQPDFLFVAYGPPDQEKWIFENKKYLSGVVCMGVGGAFKLISGKVLRAPKILVTAGLEWLWRFIIEPQRIITKMPRYIQFIKVILKHIINEKIFSSL